MKTLYEILGIARDATEGQIRKAWKNLVKIYHPDMGSAANRGRFDEVQQAYEILTDQERRSKYDETGVVEAIVPDQQYQRAITIIAGAMQHAIMNNKERLTIVDLVARMRDVIEIDRKKVFQNQELCEQFIKDMDRLIGRFKKTDGGQNVLEDMIRANRAQAEKNRENFPRALEDLSKALEILKGYRFDLDKLLTSINPIYTAQTSGVGGMFFFSDVGDQFKW